MEADSSTNGTLFSGWGFFLGIFLVFLGYPKKTWTPFFGTYFQLPISGRLKSGTATKLTSAAASL